MSERIQNILAQIEHLESELKEEISKKEGEIAYKIQNGKIRFDKNRLATQKAVMTTLLQYFKEMPFLHLISSPVIYFMVIPAIFMDITLFFYQQIIFRIYKIPFVKRSDYIVFDRHYLAYLNPIEKFNCLYCSYFNGLMQYAAEIAGKTELYFCPIKHAKKVAQTHHYYQQFLNFGDEKDFQQKWQERREAVQKR